MNPLEIMLWAGTLIVMVAALGAVSLIGVVVLRGVREQLANLAAHRARRAKEIAEAKAAEQRAELEAADILERRLALPYGGTGASLGEQLAERLDRAAVKVQQIGDQQTKQARALATLSARLTALQTAPVITHTDEPLKLEKDR